MLDFNKVFSSKPLFCFKFLAIVLLLIIHTESKANTMEIINHSNIYSGITGIFSSTNHGIVFSNEMGVYSIDKETGAITNIEFDSPLYYGFDTFFEVNGVLYFYRTQANMYEIYEGRAVHFASNVVAHYVKDDKIYLIRGKEPRIEVISSTKRDSYNTGDESGTHLYAHFIEMNDDLLGFIRLNWTGTALFFKMTDKGPEYIIAPGLPGYAQFKELMPSRIRNVQGEIWVKCFYDNYRFVDGEMILWDEQFSFTDEY